MKLYTFFKDILAPKKCYSCRQEGHFLCQHCLQLSLYEEPFCYICKGPSKGFLVHEYCRQDEYFDRILVLSHYKKDPLKKMIQDFKFHGKHAVGEDFGNYLGDFLFETLGLYEKEAYIILPIPLHFFKKIRRGYNQSEILAKYIAKSTEIPYQKNILKRHKYTRQQSQLSREQRLQNIQDAFKIRENHRDALAKKKVILVDDVVSTGTTLNAAARVLKEFGVEEVIGVCIASD